MKCKYLDFNLKTTFHLVELSVALIDSTVLKSNFRPHI